MFRVEHLTCYRTCCAQMKILQYEQFSIPNSMLVLLCPLWAFLLFLEVKCFSDLQGLHIVPCLGEISQNCYSFIIFFFVSLKLLLFKIFYFALNTVRFFTSNAIPLLFQHEIPPLLTLERHFLPSFRLSYSKETLVPSKSMTLLQFVTTFRFVGYSKKASLICQLKISCLSSSNVTTKLLSNSQKNYSVFR